MNCLFQDELNASVSIDSGDSNIPFVRMRSVCTWCDNHFSLVLLLVYVLIVHVADYKICFSSEHASEV